MPYDFPVGVTSRGIPVEGNSLNIFSPWGRIFFVQSTTGNDSNAGTKPAAPLASILAAVNKCTTDQNDVIIVGPNHAESIANSTSLLVNVAGTTILGVGKGTKRPTITFTNAAASIPISVANVKISNLLLTVSGTTDVTTGIATTSSDIELTDIEWRDGSSTAQFVVPLVLSTSSDRAKIVRPKILSNASGDALTAGIHCAVGIDGVEIIDADIDGLASNGLIYNVTTAMSNLKITRGKFRQRHATKDSAIAVAATTTGFIDRPIIRTATNDTDGFNLAIVAAAMQVYDALVVNADGERGGYWGTASTA